MLRKLGGWVCCGTIVVGILFFQPTSFGTDGTSIFDDNYKPPVIEHPAPAPAPNPSTSPVQPAPVPPAPASSLPPTGQAPAEPGEVVAGKLPAPDSVTKAQLLKLVKQIFETEYSAKSPDGKKVLAGVLLTEANKIKSNFPAKFVLLQESQAAALSAERGIEVPDRAVHLERNRRLPDDRPNHRVRHQHRGEHRLVGGVRLRAGIHPR